MKRAIIAFLAVLIFSSPALAATSCKNVVNLSSIRGVLYKPSNLHGGRGPTLIISKASERTYKPRLQIRSSTCKVIATIGLYKCDSPYGCRHYMRSGGSGQTASQLLSLAKRKGGGSSAILFQAKGKDRWLKVNNPLNRQGSL